jgi:hypothetical protein
MDAETKKRIDAMWLELGLGEGGRGKGELTNAG